MLAAVAEASAVFERDDYLEVARSPTQLTCSIGWWMSGRLRRTDSNSENGAQRLSRRLRRRLSTDCLVLHSADGDPMMDH